MTPSEIRLDNNRTRLSIVWDNGTVCTYAAALLRDRARDAGSLRMAINAWAVPATPDLRITDVQPVGNYAVRLAFSDGHDRGIFPWSFLADIADLRLDAAAGTSCN
jgi:DUF971 family protein